MPEEVTLPEREFNNDEVYPLMEQLVAEAVEVLLDFPGFVERRGLFHECTDERDNPIDGWGSIELKYAFSDSASLTEQVRQEYTDILRDAWTEAGYEISWDEASPDGSQYNLEASRSDGIVLWWRVLGRTSLTIQSGCVPLAGDDVHPDTYIPPIGGVLPENDPFGNAIDLEVYNTETPSGQSTDAAVNPFSDGAVVAYSAPLDSNPFTGEL
ncbi:hypothetical protein AB0K52_23580 [Glycomyces sp. NPDC049804]|uniref:hypothetical protein n=1 Tax=Glycomyces sp. NPDC049804 TaxID=3154363 RepID=UPI00343CF16D